MTGHVLLSPSGDRRVITLEANIAQGTNGTIHPIRQVQGVLAKIYKPGVDLKEYRQKVDAMLHAPPRLPPFSFRGKQYIQIAWPVGTIEDLRGSFRGFAMPEVDIAASTEVENILQKSSRRRHGLPEFPGNRLLLAANLATLVAELHSASHFMIDMKPANLRFYPSSSYLAVLDTDGFSIAGNPRWPARQFTVEYIAPEAKSSSPEMLAEPQDRFALAVIIFRLLNNGMHPFQGADISGTTQATTLQERINANLYAFGLSPSTLVKPPKASMHVYLEDTTRALFDRAFSGFGHRPSAAEWSAHLQTLVPTLQRCKKSPEHGHFSKGCGQCAMDRRLNARARTTSPSPVATPTFTASPPVRAATLPAPVPLQPGFTSGAFQKVVWGGIGLLLVLAFGLMISEPRPSRQELTPSSISKRESPKTPPRPPEEERPLRPQVETEISKDDSIRPPDGDLAGNRVDLVGEEGAAVPTVQKCVIFNQQEVCD